MVIELIMTSIEFDNSNLVHNLSLTRFALVSNGDHLKAVGSAVVLLFNASLNRRHLVLTTNLSLPRCSGQQSICTRDSHDEYRLQ